MYPMTDDDRLQLLHDQGYAVFPGFLDRATTARIRELIDRLLPVATSEPATGPKVMRHPIDDPLMTELLLRPELLELARRLARSVRVEDLMMLEQVLIRTDRKAPPYGPGGWHVDMAFRPADYASTPRGTYYHMVHLCNDVGPGGGSFMIVPGSHNKMYAFTGSIPEYADPKGIGIDQITAAGVDLSAGIEVHGAEGDLLVFNPMCAHSASGNCTDQPRYVYFASFMDLSAAYLRDHLRVTAYRDKIPDYLRAALPPDLHLLDR
jgi:hypothetical protein